MTLSNALDVSSFWPPEGVAVARAGGPPSGLSAIPSGEPASRRMVATPGPRLIPMTRIDAGQSASSAFAPR